MTNYQRPTTVVSQTTANDTPFNGPPLLIKRTWPPNRRPDHGFL